jgi:hypothetical protein
MAKTQDMSDEEVAEPTKSRRDYSKRPMTLLTDRLGLPPINNPRVDFRDFVKYWTSISDKPIARQIFVYIYPLFPKLNFPQGEHNIGKIPGETPIRSEEEILSRFGLGDFHFLMQYAGDGLGKTLVQSWLLGFKDNLPGFHDFQNHPPLFIRDPKYVVLTDERNIKSGYIEYLKSKGQLPGAAEESSKGDSNMADVERSAVGRVLEKVVDKAFADPPQQVQQEHIKPPDHPMEMIRETLSTVNEMNKQNTVNMPELITAIATATKQEPVKFPEPPPPVDFSPFTKQISDLTTAVIQMHNTRAADLQAQLVRQGEMLVEALKVRSQPQPVVQQASQASGLDALVDQVEKIEKVKTALGFTQPPADVEPRRRRRDEDEDEDDGGKKPWWEGIMDNLPAIIAGVTTLGGIIVSGMHNARVLQTGEGSTVAPPAAPANSGLPFQAPPFPAASLLQQPQMQPHAQTQAAAAGPTFAPQQMQTPHDEAQQFAAHIAPGLTGAFDRGETGYEYAELFIKSYGRPGAFGYDALRSIGNTPPFGNPADGFNPQTCVQVLAGLLKQAPIIWNRIGNDPRLGTFLLQFITFDEFIKEAGVTTLTKLYLEYDVESVAEYLALPELMPEEDGGMPDDDDEDSPQDAPAVAGQGTAAEAEAAGRVPEVVQNPQAEVRQRTARKPRPVNVN